MSGFKGGTSRRSLIKTGLASIIASGVSPLIMTRGAWAQNFCNNPDDLPTATFGLNLPLTGT